MQYQKESNNEVHVLEEKHEAWVLGPSRTTFCLRSSSQSLKNVWNLHYVEAIERMVAKPEVAKKMRLDQLRGISLGECI